MRQKLNVQISPYELRVIINFYLDLEKQGNSEPKDELRFEELYRIYNREVKKYNKSISLFEAD